MVAVVEIEVGAATAGVNTYNPIPRESAFLAHTAHTVKTPTTKMDRGLRMRANIQDAIHHASNLGL